MKLVYVILVNYNGYKDTIECVNSLRKINYSNFKIIIVDNGSNDDSLEILKQNLNDCIILECKENRGFSGGNNIGINYALKHDAEYILMLNNDTLVEADFLNYMVESFECNNNIGLVGCKIMYYDYKNIIWYGGGYIDWFKFTGMNFQIGKEDIGQCNVSKEISFMTGCCMLIKKEVFQSVGYLSEDYFMYYEDVDLCVRINDAGYKIWYNPKAIVYHKVGISSGGEESPFFIKWCTRNRIVFMNKYKYKVNKYKFILSKIYFYGTRIVRLLQYILKSERKKAKAIIDGIKDAIL